MRHYDPVVQMPIAVPNLSSIKLQKTALRDGESNPGLPRTAEQVWTSSDMTGGDTYHYTITDWRMNWRIFIC